MEINNKRVYAVKIGDIKCMYFYKTKTENLKEHGFPWCLANIDCSQYDEYTRRMYPKFKDKYILVTSNGFTLTELFTGKVIANLEANANFDLDETMSYIQVLKKHPLNVDYVHWSIAGKIGNCEVEGLQEYLDKLEESASIIFNDALRITAEEDYRYAANENKVYEYKKQNNLL